MSRLKIMASLSLSIVTSCIVLLISPVSAFVIPNTSRRLNNNHPSTVQLYSSVSDTDDLLTDQRAHAWEVFQKYHAEGKIASHLLLEVLRDLDIEANEDDVKALFRYLDQDDNGEITFDEFLPWYSDAVDAASEVADSFQSLIIGRRTVEQFDQTPVSNDILKRAVQCAIAAPNRSMSEPWRFITVGPQTIAQFAKLNAKVRQNMETDTGTSSVYDWTTIPGWCVVTNKITPNDEDAELDDYKSTCCAIQNFMLSMWSEGVGTKWTSGPVQKTQEFADLCGVDTTKEKVIGCIWYGFATGGSQYADPRRRKKTVDDVLTFLP